MSATLRIGRILPTTLGNAGKVPFKRIHSSSVGHFIYFGTQKECKIGNMRCIVRWTDVTGIWN